MRQAPTGSPAASTGTVLTHWPVHETATMRPAGTTPEPTARRDADTISRHHSSASWVAAPSAARRCRRGWCSDQARAPVEGDQADLGPAGAQVDGQNVVATRVDGRWHVDGWLALACRSGGQASAGMACWPSIMSP